MLKGILFHVNGKKAEPVVVCLKFLSVANALSFTKSNINQQLSHLFEKEVI